MTSPHAARRRPPGRYDPPSLLGARTTAVVLGVLFVALMVAVAATLYVRFGSTPVEARVVGFEVLSEEVVRIDVEVLKPAGSEAYCYLRARGADGAEVGRDAVVVDPVGTARRVVRLQHDLATRERAVTGEAGRCSDEPLPPPRTAP